MESNYAKFLPNTMQMKFAKFLLGVNKGAVNNAVLSELGMFPLSLSAIKNTLNFWVHIVNTSDSTLVRKAYNENSKLSNCFCSKLESLFNQLGFTSLGKLEYHVQSYIFTFCPTKIRGEFY